MKMIIDLPESILASADVRAGEVSMDTSEWLSRVLVEVMQRNEIYYLRNDVIDWREELLS